MTTELGLIAFCVFTLAVALVLVAMTLSSVTSKNHKNLVSMIAQMDERTALERRDRQLVTRKLFMSLKPDQASLHRQTELAVLDTPVPNHSSGAPANGTSPAALVQQMYQPSLAQRAPAEIERRQAMELEGTDIFDQEDDQ